MNRIPSGPAPCTVPTPVRAVVGPITPRNTIQSPIGSKTVAMLSGTVMGPVVSVSELRKQRKTKKQRK